MKITDERYKQIIEYYQKYPDKFFEEIVGVKLKWYQKLFVRRFMKV